ncbi:MAG: 50S ribosomal protein L19e [Candidatus Micrarchaeota archaeon]
MQANKIRRLASTVLKTGETGIWFDETQMDKVTECMTKEDVRQLINQGIIKKRLAIGQSKGRSRKLALKKKKGRRRGFGKRGGTQKTRSEKKKNWMKRVRSQRTFLRELKKKKKMDSKTYQAAYKRISGGFFKGKKNIEQAVKG